VRRVEAGKDMDIKTYKVVILGVSGSGKTVYLSSMFQRLSVQSPDVGFFIQPDGDEIQIQLANKYTEIVDPSRDWPPGTTLAEGQDLSFTCLVQGENANHPVFRFSYSEYAGEVLERTYESSPGSASPSGAILEKARQADALLILIDGAKVWRLLSRGETEPLRRDFALLLPTAQSLAPDRVFHFVLSKWDVLEPYGLRTVREKLLSSYPQFSDIVYQRRQHGIPTRLIPVSSVGSDFAKLDDNGLMSKLPNAVARPVQVEVPIACTLIDAFQNAMDRAREDLAKKQTGGVRGRLSSALRFFHADPLAEVFRLLPLQFQFVPAIAQLLTSIIDGPLGQGGGNRSWYVENVHDANSAMESAVRSYGALIARLELQFPESNLLRP
jgi:hypothetical protein